MIVINKGHTYGKREKGKVIPISCKDGPIKLDGAEETRLVALGVAHFVFADDDETIKENPDDGLNDNKKEKPDDGLNDNKKEKPLSDYTIAALKALAKNRGIDIPKKCKNKADIVAAIEKAAGSSGETTADDSGEIPDIKTQLPE